MEQARQHKRDEKQLSFEERLQLKQQSGYDHFNSREKLAQRKEASKQHQATKGKVKDKKGPRERYSKLPVSTLKQEKHREKAGSGYVQGEWTGHRDFARDPRFESTSGHLNAGLFAKSYSFIKDYQNERFTSLKDNLREAKRQGDEELITRLSDMLKEEKQFSMKQKQAKQAKEQKDSVKRLNKDRIQKGMEPIYLK